MKAKRTTSLSYASPLSPTHIPPAFAEQLDRQSLSTDDDVDADNLPFPTALPRQPFALRDFSPADFLATFSKNRHQTLADLRSDLEARSTSIAGELQTLVNDEYAAFLSLGAALQGGEEKCQEVKVGVLGFKKGVVGVRTSVIDRRKETEKLLAEKEELDGEIAKGRAILAVVERVEDLEAMVEDTEWDSEDDEDEDEEDGENGTIGGGVLRLNRLVRAYVGTSRQVNGLKEDMHAKVLETVQARLKKVRETLLIDLSTALKEAKSSGSAGNGRLLKVLTLYGDLDAKDEAIKITKASKPKP